MPTHTFTLNGKKVSVDCDDDERLLWVIRDLLHVHGPKYGCGLDVCKACTCHIDDGKAFNPCSVRVKDVEGRTITTIEGLPGEFGLDNEKDLHPMQEAWMEADVPQCGYCQPGQIMAAVAKAREKGGTLTDDDLDEIRNICRCGTYNRIREAAKKGAAKM
jgi:isoquinoline 1-oxidoreductase alpha subunit